MDRVLDHMLEQAKLFLGYILFGSVCLGSTIPAFDSFHSNIGEILVLSPFEKEFDESQNKPSNSLKAKLQSKAQKESEIIISPIEEPIPSPSVDQEPILSDEEINEILFDESFEPMMDWEEEIDLLFEQPDWYKFYALKMGWGYSDNPLDASYNPQKSQFTELHAESFFLNQKNPQHEMLLYLFAEGKSFHELESEEISGLVLSQFTYSLKPSASNRSYGLKLQHTFFDQGMDFSQLGLPYRKKITSKRFEISPSITWEGKNIEEGKLEFNWSEERLRQYPDQNSKFGISATLSNKSTKPVQWQTKIFHTLSKYRDRKPKDGSGIEEEGNLKTYHIGLFAKISSAAKEGWSKDLSISAGIEKVDDYPGDFYENKRFRTSLDKKFEIEDWESDLSIGYNRTRYSDRLVSNKELFSKDNWSFGLGLSRSWDESWRTYAKWMHESDQSNDPEYEFESNSFSVGMAWEK